MLQLTVCACMENRDFVVSLTMETAASEEEWEYRDSDCLQPQSRPEADDSQRWRPEQSNVVHKQEFSV